MARMTSAKALAIACGLAVAAGSAACDRTRPREARGHEGAAINLVGCLQKDESGRNAFILTQVNSPSQSVGTSGSAAAQSGSAGAPARGGRQGAKRGGEKPDW